MNFEDLQGETMEHAMEMIFVIRSDGRISYANPLARRTLLFGVDILMRNVDEIFPKVFRVENGSIVLEDPSEMIEVMAYRKNKTCFPVRFKAHPLTNDTGAYLCFAYDESVNAMLTAELKRDEERSQSADIAKNEFFATFTHELRTPVNGILGNARELMEMDLPMEAEGRLALIERECREMNALIDQILDFAKAKAGKIVLEERVFDFRNLLEGLWTLHHPKMTEKGLRFYLYISPEVPRMIMGDELRIEQILNNLLSNAVKFTTTGSITLEVFRTAQTKDRIELFVMVMDTGAGISEENLETLFERYEQEDASVSRNYGGTGLGLAITRQLVELMGGRISVDSEKGKGSAFHFNLWLRRPEQEGDVPELPESALRTPEEAMQRWTEMLHEEKDTYHQPETVENIEKALRKLELCVTMDNWEKAELFADMLREYTDRAPQEVRSKALRLKMNVQKGDAEKWKQSFDAFEKAFREDDAWKKGEA